MFKILLPIITFLFSFSLFADHLYDGQVVTCEVIDHRSTSPIYGDKIYPQYPKNFKFKIKIQNEKGGILELSKNGQELFVNSFLKFEFAFYHFDKDMRPEDVSEIRGFTETGSFEYDDNIIVYSSSFARMRAVEYLIAECDSF